MTRWNVREIVWRLLCSDALGEKLNEYETIYASRE